MHVMTVRKKLYELYKDVENFELLEFSGGIYSPDKLLSANYVFVITEQKPLVSENKMIVTVGRGVYSEVRQFLDEKIHDELHQIFFCCFTEENLMFDIYQILGIRITNMDSWLKFDDRIEYGKIITTTIKSDFPLTLFKL